MTAVDQAAAPGTEPEAHELERLTIYVPRGMRRAVKIAAACEETTLSAWVGTALAAALPKYGPHTIAPR